MNEIKETINFNKAVIVGCGFVGSASAFCLMQSGLFTELVLIDSDSKRAEGEALDISHGIPFSKPMKIHAGDYDDVKNAGIVIVTAGANQQPGETRLDLVKKNINIFKTIIPEIKKRKKGRKKEEWRETALLRCIALLPSPFSFLLFSPFICTFFHNTSDNRHW